MQMRERPLYVFSDTRSRVRQEDRDEQGRHQMDAPNPKRDGDDAHQGREACECDAVRARRHREQREDRQEG